MTIEQTVEIPANHRLTIDVPREIPEGRALLTLSISPGKKPVKMSGQMKKLMKYYGCLKDSPAFEGDSVEIVRKMREEWDRPWDADVKA